MFVSSGKYLSVGCAVRTKAPPIKADSPVGCAMRTINTRTKPDQTTRYITCKHGKMDGLSYVEVLIATVLIAIVLVPAMDALLPAVVGSGIHETYTEDHHQLNALFEEVLAEPLTNLDAAATAAGSETTATTTYSDVYTYADGRQISRNVFLSRYDGDNADSDNNPFTGIDEGLIWVRVEIANTTLSIQSLSSE